MLAWPNGVCPDSVDGRSRVREDRVAMAALLLPIEDAQRPVDSVSLCVGNLLIGAEVVAAARLPLTGLPGTRRSHHIA